MLQRLFMFLVLKLPDSDLLYNRDLVARASTLGTRYQAAIGVNYGGIWGS